MNYFNKMKDDQGSTLLEAIVAIFIITIGIFAAMTMQLNATSASSASLLRTDANNLAISFLETLKQLDFDDPLLAPTSATMQKDNNDRTFTAATLPAELQNLIQVSAAGAVTDKAGVTYQLSWDVQTVLASAVTPGAGPAELHRNIRLYMTWGSLMGQNSLEMTTIKYNNISL